MTAIRGYLITAVVFLGLGIGGGLGFGWNRWRPKTVVETAVPEVRQKDQSLELARVPDAHAKPTATIPKGQTVARIENVTVQPNAFVKPDTVWLPATATEPAREIIKPDTVLCPPVRVQLTLTDLPDGTHRVIASSPDGQVTGGLDIAVKNAVVPKVLRWSAGPLYASHAAYGAFLGYQAGPTQLIAGGAREARGGSAFVGVGLRF
jgi:hypothetical protein